MFIKQFQIQCQDIKTVLQKLSEANMKDSTDYLKAVRVRNAYKELNDCVRHWVLRPIGIWPLLENGELFQRKLVFSYLKGYFHNLYTNPDTVRNRLNGSTLRKFDLWLAHRTHGKAPVFFLFHGSIIT